MPDPRVPDSRRPDRLRSSSKARAALVRRRDRARAGGTHDRLIGGLRIVLPMAVGVLGALLAAAPLLGGRDISFVLSKDRVAVVHDRMRVTTALYRGQDGAGQPFSLTAASAVQRSTSDPVVRLNDLTAQIQLDDGPASFVAPRGRYDMDHAAMWIDGPVAFKGPGGYRMDTHDVSVDLATRTATSGSAVTGSTDMGTFRADRMTANLATRVVQLDGAVRLRIPHPRAK